MNNKLRNTNMSTDFAVAMSTGYTANVFTTFSKILFIPKANLENMFQRLASYCKMIKKIIKIENDQSVMLISYLKSLCFPR